MDKRYEIFCLADRYFYDTPDRLSDSVDHAGEPAGFPVARRPVPAGWRQTRSGDWLELRPLEGEFPLQGWKIHASACLDNADTVGTAVWDYCVPRGIPFKFVPERTQLYLRNAKYAGRGTSGKFATIYPADDTQLESILNELGGILHGQEGPYILTDLRWHKGPLYVRYGGFAPRFCVDEKGQLVPAVEDGTGRLVPDRKDPAFRVPDGVELPACLRPHLEARSSTSVGELPYRIERALHFSNGGGVYGGTDLRDGQRVVLKEARPHAGLAADGADAVARLEREKAALEQLAGLPVVPGVRDWFELDGHHFLVMDELPGQTLNAFFAKRHPLLSSDPDPDAVARHTEWALRMHRLVEEAVEAVHARGIVFNDLHMFNIMVAPDEQSVALLDFEAAAPAAENPRQIVAHPGFIAPRDRERFDIDRYALACLRLALLIPMTTLLAVDRSKAADLARIAAEQFPGLPEEWLSEAVATIEGPHQDLGEGRQQDLGDDPRQDLAEGPRQTRPPSSPASGGPPVAPADWPAARESMAAAILASATPQRDDRLFPGDIAQFADGGGIGLAHGAAGVLHALAETGAATCPEGEEWLLRHTEPPPRGTPLGLYDGLPGVSCVLARFGHTKRALELTERVLDEKWRRLGTSLYGGLAGLGLALDQLAEDTGELGLRAHAWEAAHLLSRRLTAEPGETAGSPGAGAAPVPRRAGLLHGASGAALFYLRLYERRGDPALLDLAESALGRDLALCVRDSSGTLQVDEGSRTMPYLGAGSVGIAAVLDDFLVHRPDHAAFAQARLDILPAARMRYYAQPGLFQGRAGMLLHLSRTTAPGVTEDDRAAQLDGLGWYGMAYQGALAFPGDQMMRLSMDLATGTAGCLLAAGAAAAVRDARPLPGLPFMPPPRASSPSQPPHGGTQTGLRGGGRTEAPPSL
ncbi:class III lanthionine synthetase LanKC [Streptomyces sp. NBC_01795]|uniref:class III lanthionine synthetase LanKC n=1 Tax=Streptomyces sp. NBC_01795 TaxID=2975943 RepID=UPI002DD94786|nr:class III lanthionine synthetase LanKC [Streptomyces sp. NBC_01795]WSA90885.1 class III lanthionine synthetase LanKC [Streptomyces sp. NBC_01795]